MAQASYSWTLNAFQSQGNLWLGWSTTAPFRAQQGQLHVYSSTDFPSDPTSNTKAWNWDDQTSPWNTGLPWGSNWCCAWIAQKGSSGPYTYVVQLITTGLSHPDSTTSE
jgi:hypothetical protein